jgi:hypothetical protein
MAVSSISMLSVLWDKDAGAMVKWTSGLMAASMLLPIVSSAVKVLTSDKLKNTIALAASAFHITAESKALGTNTPMIVANAAAWYTHPIVWIVAIIVAVVAAVGALTYAIIKLTASMNSSA